MIREYQSLDQESVVQSWRKASALAHPFLTKEFLEIEAGNIRNVYLARAETWVIEIDGAVVGFIAMIENEIGGLFVDPEFHGRGFGRALVDHAVAEKGNLKVEVFKENVIGRRFYNGYGFQGNEEFIHDGSGHTAIRMAYRA